MCAGAASSGGRTRVITHTTPASTGPSTTVVSSNTSNMMQVYTYMYYILYTCPLWLLLSLYIYIILLCNMSLSNYYREYFNNIPQYITGMCLRCIVIDI